jgi:colicin import membrane protein
LTCIYRNLDLGAESGSIQPIDLKVLRHDRREIRSVKADLSCEVDSAGRLQCANPVRTRSWRAWIVPESVANHAGPSALEAALKSGLTDQRSAELR